LDLSSSWRDKSASPSLVTSLLEDHVDRLWVGLDSDLAVYDDGSFAASTDRTAVPWDGWVEVKNTSMTLIRLRDLEDKEKFPSPPI